MVMSINSYSYDLNRYIQKGIGGKNSIGVYVIIQQSESVWKICNTKSPLSYNLNIIQIFCYDFLDYIAYLKFWKYQI
jgi:hypothetical protein